MVIGACTDAAASCVGFTKTWAMIYFWGTYASTALLLIIFFIFWKTPALEFLISIIRGKSLALAMTRSNQGRIYTAEPDAEGMLQVSRVGPVVISPNSVIYEKISGRPLYLLFGEFAATIPPWWVSSINYMKLVFSKKGNPIHNSYELGDNIGLKFDDTTGKWIKQDKEFELQDVPIKPWITLKISDLANMFPWNITPALIESKIEFALARQLKFWKSDISRYITYAMILLFLVIIGFLAYKFFGGGAPQINIVTYTTGKLLGTSATSGAPTGVPTSLTG